MTDLVTIDSLGSVKTRDGLFEAICWTHRGGGWDVHITNGGSQGGSCRTKREAYALVRKLHADWWGAVKRQENNDSRCWT